MTTIDMNEAPTRETVTVTRRSLREQKSGKSSRTRRKATSVADRPSAVREMLRALWIGLSGALLALALGLAALVVVVPLAVGGQALTVLTNSMAPGMPPGTLVIVKPTAVGDISVGDVLTYQIRSGDPAVVSHRVVSRSISTSGETTFITRGDNNDVDDANPVTAAQIKGTVWYSLPYLGWVNSAMSGNARAWLIPAIAVACFGYGAWAFASSYFTRRRARAAARRRDESPNQKPHGRRSRIQAEELTGADR